jgi:hypothetical protein
LILFIFADGELYLKPKLIFHGMPPPTGRILHEEGHLYSPDVTVEFNETAYNNEALFTKWIKEELFPYTNRKEHLLVMDVAGFHKTQEVLQLLRENSVIPALIPPGCTSLLQPLDTAVNRPFKTWLCDAIEEYVARREAEGKVDWSVRDKRIMTTWVVAAACKKLVERRKIVQDAFSTAASVFDLTAHRITK